MLQANMGGDTGMSTDDRAALHAPRVILFELAAADDTADGKGVCLVVIGTINSLANFKRNEQLGFGLFAASDGTFSMCQTLFNVVAQATIDALRVPCAPSTAAVSYALIWVRRRMNRRRH